MKANRKTDKAPKIIWGSDTAINIGGMLRCCADTLDKKVKFDKKFKIGDKLKCTVGIGCKGEMILEDKNGAPVWRMIF